MSTSPLHEKFIIHNNNTNNNNQDDLISSSYEKELPSSKRIKLTHIEHNTTTISSTNITTVLSKSVTNIANGNHNQVWLLSLTTF
jgi:hypothetical protein